MRLATDNPVTLDRSAFKQMLDFVHMMESMAYSSEYSDRLNPIMPPTARLIPDRPSMLMGYDFHLATDSPKLIEINNNAGGLHALGTQWVPQPEIPELSGSLEARLLEMFPSTLRHIAILDEDIEHQHMYPEMQAYAELLRRDGRSVWLVTPEKLELRENGLWVEGVRLDGIYNRHTDFYLESEAMAPIRQAFMLRQVDLNPFPRSYALLGEKSRMADWWRPGWLDSCLDAKAQKFLHSIVPETHMLNEMDANEIWAQRKHWVFKPAARHGGKGVIVGKNISRTRYSSMGEDTVIQRFVAPSVIQVDDKPMKFDVRVYTYGSRLIAVAGRIWQGQITNFRTEGSGWVALNIV